MIIICLCVLRMHFVCICEQNAILNDYRRLPIDVVSVSYGTVVGLRE